MNILLLFIFNVFTGALIYLILTLKIEKNSATFQEKKLKREMAEIIREFNSTAERNITILENYISTLKKLMNENGSLKGIDFTVLDNRFRNNSVSSDIKSSKEQIDQKKIPEANGRKINDKIKSLKQNEKIIDTFIDKIHSFNANEDVDTDKETQSSQKSNIKDDVPMSGHQKIDLFADEDIIINYENEKPVDMADLFQNAEDKYLLIAKLYNEGHSVEDLSRYSGLPSGEIKLVISLNS